MKLLVGAGMMAMLLMATAASAITYTEKRVVGSGTVQLSLTTDGTLGVLNSANFIDWTIFITDPDGNFTLSGPLSGDTSELSIQGSAFTATATSLLFDFDAGGEQYVLFQDGSTGSGQSYWCLETANCVGGEPQESIYILRDTVQQIHAPRSGLQVIASVGGPVPEPASWALMLGGFGLVGAVLRRRVAAMAELSA